jgi:DNA-directed RNA polymerase subunit N (RpoN/RPB10)
MSNFPPRCFTCGKVIGGIHPTYSSRIDAGENPYEVLDDLKVGRPCCRRMFTTYVDTDRFVGMYPTHPGRIHRIGPKHTAKPEDSDDEEVDEDAEEEEQDEEIEEEEQDEEEEQEEEEDVEEDENEEEDVEEDENEEEADEEQEEDVENEEEADEDAEQEDAEEEDDGDE